MTVLPAHFAVSPQPLRPRRFHPLPRIAWRLAGWLALALCLFPAQAQTSAQPPVQTPAQAQPRGDVTELRLEYTPAGVLLSAVWRMELAPVVESALYQGIAMHFVADAQVVRPRWYWSDKTVAHATRHLRLSYQPLTRRWRLTQSSSRDETASQPGLALGQSFDALDDALAALQRLAGWKIAEAAAVEEGATYQVQFQFRLDISQMPRPLQFGAVGRSGWNLALSRRMDWTPAEELP